ncbi:MAG: rod-binding protein [Bacillota bacterium]
MTVARTQAGSSPSLTSQAKQHEQLTRAAQRWVSQAFYGTILKQMHESPFKSELFSGGRGGETFSTLLDQQMTDRMARSSDHNLVASIVRSIERNQQPKGAANPLASATRAQVTTNLSQKASSYVAPTR